MTLRLDRLEAPVDLPSEELADAAEGIQEILDAVALGVLDICPPLIAVLVRVLDTIESLLILEARQQS